MGNQKSLYKTYFNEVYLKRNDDQRKQSRPQTGIDNPFPSSYQTPSSSSSSRQTPDSLVLGGAASQLSHQPYQKNALASGRATADLVASSSRLAGYHTQRNQKNFKVIIDNNYTINISIPDKIPSITDEDSNCGTAGELPTCGWLLEQVEKKYAQLIKELKTSGQPKNKLRKKIIVALKTLDKNENIDYWLTQYQRTLKALPNGLTLEPHFSKIIKNKPKALCSNDFEMLKVIGKGGFSKVYMVRKKDTGFIYAMKVMKKDQVTNESKLKQIMNERTIMETLADHPFVIKLHYAFQSKENLHFIIDFCTGGEMFYHLQQKQRYPEFMAKFYFAEILLGIEYLHNQHIVYRDLKPENVLIDTDGHIKLADFGLSKIFKVDERSFSFCGSPEYMCPEILKREGHNHMVDYYTLGAILYEMMTGIPPHYTNNKSEMTRRILESELSFPQYLSPEAVSLMQELLERNPTKRIGAKAGVEEIKAHEWCSDIDWEAFLNKKLSPPWKPSLERSNFDPEYTNLDLDFDESNFKRALQGDREFSFYYESPCQSLTVTEHSIYASNPDLTNTTNQELLLQSGSSKQLLEHFFNQQPNVFTNRIERQPSVLSPRELAEIFSQQKIKLQMNTDLALKINQDLIRDDSKISLEYNKESGLTNFRGFSFYGESQEEKEVKSQLIKYTKLRNKLNKRLKQIQDEEGVIREKHLKDIELSTPSSNLSIGTITTILPTPPVLEDASSRNSLPSQYQRQGTQRESFSAMSGVQKIDKLTKQQMIMARLGAKSDFKTERKLMYQSFQPDSINKSAVTKKQELFRSNIDQTKDTLLLSNNLVSLSHKDYLNESIKDLNSSHDAADESVADERDSSDGLATVHATNPHPQMGSSLEFYPPSRLEASLEESKEESITPQEILPAEGGQSTNLNNVKFILFKSQNVSKKQSDKGIITKQSSKMPARLIVTQRSRMTHQKEEVFPNQSKDYSSLSGSNNTTTLRFQLATTGGGTSNGQQNSSSSQAMTSSRDKATMESMEGGHRQEKTPVDRRLMEETDDLDKTANIIQQQEKLVLSAQTSLKHGSSPPNKSNMKKSGPTIAGFKRKNLEIETTSPEQRSKMHSKKVSIAENVIITNIEEIEEFKVSHIKKMAQTVKYSDGKKGEGFNFDFNGMDESEPSQPTNNTFQSASGGAQFSGMRTMKKLSQHSKQISADITNNELYGKIIDKMHGKQSINSSQQQEEEESKKDQSLRSFGSKKPTITTPSTKGRLTKNTTTTASTINFRTEVGTTKLSKNKPPLNIKADTLPLKKNNISGTKGFGMNSSSGTPSGKKGQISLPSKSSITAAISQPSSAKNAQSNKFSFPGTANSAEQPSPSKKISTSGKQVPSGFKSLKAKPTQQQSQIPQLEESEEQAKITRDFEVSNKGYIVTTLQAQLKPPKTTKNSQAKGFF